MGYGDGTVTPLSRGSAGDVSAPSVLQQIQPTAQQIAEAIASVLDIEVTIVDDTLVRIAGTGDHRNTIGQPITGQSLYRSAISNCKEFVVTDVSTDQKCSTCSSHRFCKELATLCCPIVASSGVIGVIGLMAFSPERQRDILGKIDDLLPFIRRMADLIAAKAAENDRINQLLMLKNQLETVLNFIAEGIIAIDAAARITSINDAARKMLRVRESDVIGIPIADVFPGTPIPDVLPGKVGFANREVNVWQNGRHLHYFITARPMISEGRIPGVVASFRPVEWSAPAVMETAAGATFDTMIGGSPTMAAIKREARKAAETASTVLIIGESGTGKDILAQAIHMDSARRGKPFVAVNCAAIPEHLLESELFGYEEGSFTGARKGGKAGKFQSADGGTLFLDEIGDMPLALQAKMLRVLQEKVVEPVGSLRRIAVNVRIIAATNRDLADLMAAGKFRDDLYYRLNVFPLSLPPLRDRDGDVLELAAAFLEKYATAYGKPLQSLSPEARRILGRYSWPGNIRELENAIECAVIRSSGTVLTAENLPIRSGPARAVDLPEAPPPAPLPDCPERGAILEALDRFGTSVKGKQEAARHLGMGVATLYRKIKKYDLA